MFLRGLGQDNGFEDDYGMTGGAMQSSLPPASSSWPTASTNWTGLLETALKTWGGYENTQAQLEVQKMYAARGIVPNAPYSPYSMSPLPRAPYGAPGYLPYPGAGSGGTLLDFTPLQIGIGLLIAGGVALAVSNR